MINSRCVFQKRARKKLLENLNEELGKLKGSSDLYFDDIAFEIEVLKCKDCKVTVYHNGSWIDELCDKHSKESKLL